MTDPVLDELLASEGLSSDGLDDLVAWAKERAAALAAEAAEDPELGPLLADVALAEPRGERSRPISRSDATTEPRATASLPGPTDGPRSPLEAVAAESGLPVRRGGTQPRAMMPTAQHPNAADAGAARPESSYVGDMPQVYAAAAQAELARGPARGPAEDSLTEELNDLDLELIEEDELEMVDDGPSTPPDPAEAAPPPPPPPPPVPEAPTYGPPDGNEQVPEWKAALYSAELGDDRAAAARIKEESHVGPIPEEHLPPGAHVEQPRVERLVAEEDEISQHAIDLSDLDGDPGESDSTSP